MSALIRAATETDFTALLDLVKQAIPETYLAEVPVDSSAVKRWLFASESQKHLYCIRVAERDKKLVGFIFAGMAPVFFNPAHRIADECLLYVHPSARMSTIAQDLLWSFMEWAGGSLAKITPTGKADSASELLTRMGFSRIGSIFMRDTPNGRRISPGTGTST
mgnify:CR=1 FL=1